MRRHAVVLRSGVSKRQVVALLDEQFGRVDYLVRSPREILGTLISYQLHSTYRYTYMIDICIEGSPLAIAHHDLLFLHHVLEICYVCIPIGSCTDGIFALLQSLYQSHEVPLGRQYKKLFLYRLLSQLGVSSGQYHMSRATVQQIQTFSIDSFVEESLHLEHERDLDVWLRYSVAEYTNPKQLKTIHFLNQSRIA